jgi:hypothetical protein
MGCCLAILSACGGQWQAAAPAPDAAPVVKNTLRAPAYPLVTIDPYTSAWSTSDRLYADTLRHWTGKPFPLLGVIRVDGQSYRFMGSSGDFFAKAAKQNSVDVQATQTRYAFTCGPVDLQLTFTAPYLPDSLVLLSRPVDYISYEVKPNDGGKHQVELYFEASPLWALNTPDEASQSSAFEEGGYVFLKAGSKAQAILKKKGDDVRIDWGYFYLSAAKPHTSYAVGDGASLRKDFAANGRVAKVKASADGHDLLALTEDLGKVASPAGGHVQIGYDDIYSIQYFGENLRPYWNRHGDTSITTAFIAADKSYASLKAACDKFDNQLIRTATAAGGQQYADLCALAYRQAFAAHKLVQAPNGDLLFLAKENFSNGSIGTVDVTYPSAPLFLYYNPELVKGLLNAIFYYSESGKWTKPFAAHDVGTYPQANGQTYGGDMPVEETGNMLLLMAAIASVEGNAGYAQQHWQTLTTWVKYLEEKGLDPENQLCTDDFAGHFAHNANLSIKAILAIAAYGRLAGMLGHKDLAAEYSKKARAMAAQWVKMDQDGDHFRLTFDKKGTWSQKYNLVWDKLLKLNIFPVTVAEKEIPYYLTKQNAYGLPLDSRKNYTKADWIVWTATLSPDKPTFEKFITPLYRFMNETVDRVPMSDWYNTDNLHHVGFQARSVVGGFFIKMLADRLAQAPQAPTNK